MREVYVFHITTVAEDSNWYIGLGTYIPDKTKIRKQKLSKFN